MANRAAGKGYESEANYENTSLHFAGIDNIHVMRSSLARLLESKSSFDHFLNSVLGALLYYINRKKPIRQILHASS